MNLHKKRGILLVFLLGRLGFIFFDAVFNKDKEAENIVYFKNIGVDITQQQEQTKTNDITNQNEEIEAKISKKIQNQKTDIQDLKTLLYLYNKKESPEILKQIIKKQAQNYNFNEARTNIQKYEEKADDLDINLVLYVYLNSNNISITQKESIKKILPLLDLAIQKNKIGNQDYAFYIGMIEIRNRNYAKAIEKRQQVKTPEYQPIIQSFEKAIKSYNSSKSIPGYYQDGLVSLAALKNGYFTLARKISLEVILQDDKYILPYQILSYAHFLTNNRDTSIEYFLKLASFDKKNQEMYQFLIGVSYYRKGDYTSSILYLSQNKSEKFKTDTLRYLIISYLEINEQTKLLDSRQKLLGQQDIKNSDFFLYFYSVLYKGYFSQDSSLYQANKQLTTLFIQQCETSLGSGNDVCIYGKIGAEIIENNLSLENEKSLINLANSYNQSYLYHILADFYSKQKRIEEAKKYYAKTIASSQDPKEIDFVQKKLTTF